MALTIAFLAALAFPAQASSPALWAGLKAGPYAVGYVHFESGEPIDVWYPAGAPGQPLTFAQYLGGRAAGMRSFLKEQGLPEESIARLLDASMFATREAVPAARPEALVLMAQGNGQDAADQAVLAEYIASHGYIVASVPSPMIRQPMTGQSQIGSFAERQADALEAAMRRVRRILPARRERVAVIGHSFGARAALLLAMRHPQIRALISLDGGIGTSTGVAEMRAAKSFRRTARLPATLHIYEDLDAFMKPNFAFLESLRARRLRIEKAKAMHHAHFTTYGFAAAVIPEFAKVTNAGPEIQVNVAMMARKVLRFLSAELE
ncbi:MAG TPA: acyl-CoA thioester hydrolase/BAAT C-terminal domain-containing protein [Thermoanaerobaculia bacterium]|jgi:dienelactone hydrolase